jgi:hypothetical protein
MYKERDSTPILAGTRTNLHSLWQVPLHLDQGCATDGIPPPSRTAGIYVEANAVAMQDNAAYVRFVHACMGYPAPTTFLRAVTAGFIKGPNQFPRLTPKMVRKHLPNAMVTAKWHLDRAPSGAPHGESDAVSAQKTPCHGDPRCCVTTRAEVQTASFQSLRSHSLPSLQDPAPRLHRTLARRMLLRNALFPSELLRWIH